MMFNDRFQASLPADPNEANSPRQVHEACYSWVKPKKVSKPELLSFSDALAKELGFSRDFCLSSEFLQCFSGNQMLPGMKPYACCYGGHQFGNWAGQLGDGRAINLGGWTAPNKNEWVLQLKGAGPTPYSRTADGLAVLRSSLREYLCSEAMHYLGVPTTRALSLILSGDQVMRDMFYDGNPGLEPGAIVCRAAPSFTRFGNFEIFSSRGDIQNLERLAKYTIQENFPDLQKLLQTDPKQAYLAWFEKVAATTCTMVVEWMRVGFVHGVMNTDNMSILGLTIDYGPYGWIDNVDPNWTPNTTDASQRRYRFGQQGAVAQWNLLQLANALYPLIESAPELEAIVKGFAKLYETAWLSMMRAKLGLQQQAEQDAALVEDLETLLHKHRVDMTLFYRSLSGLSSEHMMSPDTILTFLTPALYTPSELSSKDNADIFAWFTRYWSRLGEEVRQEGPGQEERAIEMNRCNPKYVLRNYIAQQAIDKAHEGDSEMILQLAEVLKSPYDEQPEYHHFSAKRPSWADNKAGCSMLSCSS